MKILKRTKKVLTNEEVNKLFGEPDYSDDNGLIAEPTIAFESEMAQNNIKYINKNLSTDDDRIKYLIENNYDELDEIPVITAYEYLNSGIEYVTRIKDGKISREVIINDALKTAVTEYMVVAAPMDFEYEDYQITICPLDVICGEIVCDYESINSVIPDIVKTLLDNGYVTIEDYEEGDDADE